MHRNHCPRPPLIVRSEGYTARPHMSKTARSIRDAASYARDHYGHGQIYTYSGPYPMSSNPELNPDYDWIESYGGVVEFPVILHGEPKTDATYPSRQLGGVIVPHKYSAGRSIYGYYADRPVKVYWRHDYNGNTVNRQLYRGYGFFPENFDNADKEDRIPAGAEIRLFDYTTGNLMVDGYGEMGASAILHLWLGGNGASISHDTVNYYSGAQSIKVAHGGTANPYITGPYLDGVEQLVTGANYYVSCFAKGDGTAAPKILTGSTTIATGTSSTSWQHLEGYFEAEADVLKFQATTSTISTYVNFDNIEVKELGRFRYDPHADGEFTVGFLGVERMCVAALSIWTAPDRSPSNDQLVVIDSDMMPGRAIRGYTGTGQGSIGDLEYMMGYGGTDYSIDDVERNTRRCLLQSGHPLGLSTSEYSSYYNIRGGNASYFKIFPRNLLGLSTGNDVSTWPCLYGRTQGAAVGNEGYVKYTSITSGDTWEYAIDDDTPGLWYDTNRLTVDAAGDTVKIEVKAPPGGWIVIGSYSLWEDAYDQ